METSPPYDKRTRTYKTYNNTPISLDIYLPLNARNDAGSKPPPIFLFFHGGYLITGTRDAIPAWLFSSALSLGWTVIVPDFRVLPESDGFAVMDDLIAACHWIAHNPSEYDRTASHDHTPIILAGASAGGWCALVSALHICRTSRSGEVVQGSEQHVFPATTLQPVALLLLYPMLNLSSSRWCHSVFAGPDPMSETLVQDHLNTTTQRIRDGEISLGERFPTSEEQMRTRKRLPLLWAIMQSGKWLDYFTGLEGFATEVSRSGIEATIKNLNSKESKEGNLAELFPLDFADFGDLSAAMLTLIVHGTRDLEVPMSESERLVKKIEESRKRGPNKGGVKLYQVEDAGHVFDLDINPGKINIIEPSIT